MLSTRLNQLRISSGQIVKVGEENVMPSIFYFPGIHPRLNILQSLTHALVAVDDRLGAWIAQDARLFGLKEFIENLIVPSVKAKLLPNLKTFTKPVELP
jgi:hypothetical protein